MVSNPNIGGIKAYLRYKSLEELQVLSDNLFSSAATEVTITGTNADGGGATGEIAFPRLDYLAVVMDVRRELGDVPTDANGMMLGRQLCTKADWGRTVAVL